MNIFQTRKHREKENTLMNRMRTNEIRLYFLACASTNKAKQNVRHLTIPFYYLVTFLQFLHTISKNVSSFIFDFDYLDKLNAILEHRLFFVGILKFLLWVTFESVDVDTSIQFYSQKKLMNDIYSFLMHSYSIYDGYILFVAFLLYAFSNKTI